jgi:N utilization substance protein A
MMNKKEMLFFVEAVANEKGLPKQDIFSVLEDALASAIVKSQPEEMQIRVSLDPLTGDYEAFREWVVVDPNNMPTIEQDDVLTQQEFNSQLMISLDEARESDPEVQLGEVLEEPMNEVDFGRISIQIAKQVMFQKIREFSRRKIVEQYESRIGEIFHVTIKRIFKGQVVLDLGENTEGVIPRAHQIPNEQYSPGRRLRVYLYEVGVGGHSPQLYFSRSMPALLEELFKLEVPEIADGIIEIRAVARDPGERAKIAVYTGDPHLDPVGSCVGVRGTRIHAVTNELSNERIDIIVWNDNPAELVLNALAPAEVVAISVDEDKRSMDISVQEDLLPQAIGRSGQNVRLASQLTGWDLNVMSEKDMEIKKSSEQNKLLKLFTNSLDISEDNAKAIIKAGVSSIEEIAYMSEDELSAIKGLDSEICEQIRNTANDQILLGLLSGDDEVTEQDDEVTNSIVSEEEATEK